MNKHDFGSSNDATRVRPPVIVNQLGPELRAVLAGHWAHPRIVDHPDGVAPWDMPDGVDVLLTRPHAGWDKAPAAKPHGWPFGLRWIQTASTGVDAFPTWLFDGPVVTVGRGISADPIAEYVVAALLDFEKRLHAVRVRGPGDWKQTALGSLGGRTIGIAGFGSIGRAVAARLEPFDVAIKVLRRSPWREAERGIEAVQDVGTLVENADHLVVALPATPETTRLIGDEVFRRAKKSLHVVNVARGTIIDQAALLRALDAGQIAGATLDVTDPEPPPEGDPIYGHRNIVLTPHISWTGGASAKCLANKTLANLNAYVHGSPLADVFDKDRGY